jgi:serine/threonine-protein kinase
VPPLEQTESLVESVEPNAWAQGSELRSGRDESTRIESPGARARTGNTGRSESAKPLPPPPPVRGRRPKRRNDNPAERIGRVLGSYRLLDVLGKGGMGCVYRAEHIKLGRAVALKLLRSDYAERRDAVARFFQEARAVNRIRHRNIVDVTDFVELDDGTTVIIMELLDGSSLGRWARKRDVPGPQILAMLIQICDALIAAHKVGIVHRDLKPDNIFVVPTGDGAEIVKLLDFGVAKLLTRDEEDYGLETAAGSVIGTPAYMSPEQAGGMPVDGRSDVYSLGAIMYELFTGTPMFRAKSFGEYVRKHLNEHPTPPRETPGGRDMDEALETVILTCLAKQADDRYDSVTELREDLLHLLGAVDTSLPADATILPSSERRSNSGIGRVSSGAAPVPSVHSLSTAALSPRRRPPTAEPLVAHETAMAVGGVPTTVVQHKSSHTGLWIAALGAVAAISIVAVVLLTRGNNESKTEQAQPSAAADVLPDEGPVEVSKATTALVVTPLDDTGDDGADDVPEADPVTVRFKSKPRGTVYPQGSKKALCPTPCDVTIDPADGGSADRRDFVIRRKGYEDSAIAIDLHAPEETVNVVLERRTSSKRPVRTKPTPPTPVDVDDPPPADTPKPTTDDNVLEPKLPKDIDPSDTLNPFGNK